MATPLGCLLERVEWAAVGRETRGEKRGQLEGVEGVGWQERARSRQGRVGVDEWKAWCLDGVTSRAQLLDALDDMTPRGLVAARVVHKIDQLMELDLHITSRGKGRGERRDKVG